MPENNFSKNIFINCPYDKEYWQMLQALLFTLLLCNYEPRIASERSDSGELRFGKIKELIEESQYSIHDLSRMKSSEEGEYSRFNLPFELGLDLGCKEYGNSKYRNKKYLILVEEKYSHLRSLSDLAGVDIEYHNSDPKTLVRKIRNWIRTNLTTENIKPGSAIWELSQYCDNHIRMSLEDDKWDPDDIKELTTNELIDLMKRWIEINKSPSS